MRYRSIAGILLVLCFTFVILETILRLFVDGLLEDSNSGGEFAGLAKLAVYCVVILAVISIFTLVGAISAFTGKSFYLAIAGAACGMLAIGWNFLGSACALAALIVLIFSKNEFDGEYQPQLVPYGKDGYPPGAMPPPPTTHLPPVLNLPQDEPQPQSTHQWYRRNDQGRSPP
ncbi:MAG: hypothetical protein KAJ35_01545 [Thermoplasmata archaeon]|nr:hypothetical protein [Thermoplasmata archaeon]